MIENFLFGLALSFLAGLFTALGGLIPFFMKKPNKRFLSVAMGFSLGVMLFISFNELLHYAFDTIGKFIAYMFFFLGILLMILIDIPITHKYHFERHLYKEVGIDLNNNDNHNNKYLHWDKQVKDEFEEDLKQKLQKTSFVVLLGIFIHDFPEGMVVMIGTLVNEKLGIFLAFAIALHHIPEGIAVSIPVCAATNDKKKGFKWALYSGLSGPLGGLIFGLIIYPFANEMIMSYMLAIVAGIMVYISIDELLPASHSFGKEHLSIAGIVFGMFLMSISLSFFPV